MSWAFLVLASLIQVALCEGYVVHEKREFDLPDIDGLDRRRVEADTLLPMRIGLRQNADAVVSAEKWLMEVSDPDSSKFGQHWTQNEVIDAFQPPDESAAAVEDWLSRHGITWSTRSDNKMWFAFDLAASVAEALLHTEYFEHQTKKGTFEVSCDEYSLPEELTNHIDYITPGVKSKDITFRSKRSRAHFAAGANLKSSKVARSPQAVGTATWKQTTPPFPPNDLEHCHWSVSPACIRALYDIPVADPAVPVSSNNSMGVYEFWGVALQDDLNKFFDYYTDIPNNTAPIYHSIDGAVVTMNQTLGWRKDFLLGSTWKEAVKSESILDYQISLPVIYPQNITDFQVDDPYRSEHEDFYDNDMLDAIDGSYCTYTAFNITGNTPGPVTKPGYDPVYPDPRPHEWNKSVQCGIFKPTNVISISYLDWEDETSAPYLERQCLEYLKLALQGVTFLASSGDGGVACTRRLNKSFHFSNGSPASCPWVTAVGATMIQPYHSPKAPEEIANWSGGGFSDVFKRPWYQDATIEEYFATHDPPYPYYYNGHHQNTTGAYNRNGRGTPDVAAVGSHIAGINAGEYTLMGGTSASAPLFASIITRINEERIRVGKGSLGFINPTLYKNPEALHDIFIGNNSGKYCPIGGFQAVSGWDPASGLGTPKYPKLLEVFMNLP